MVGKNFLIINIVILVLSITPVSAFEISQNGSTDNSNSSDYIDSLISKINSDENELQSSKDELDNHNAVIDDSLSYIKSNWWKFWKLGTVFNKIDLIQSETQKISDIASKLNETALKLQKNSEELEENLKQNNNSQNPNDLKDANQMISKLNQHLNLNITTGNSNNLTTGEIIQYKSQNKYYRYLKYIKTENNNVILEGSRNKLITVSQEEFLRNSNLKFITNNSSNSKIVNEAYKIQNTEINKQIKNEKSNQKTYEGLTIAGTVIGGLGSILVIVGLTIFGMALALIFFTAATSVSGMAAGVKIAVVGFALLITGGSLLIAGLTLLCETNKEINSLNNILADLELYDDGLNHPPIAENMTLTTNGTSLNSTLNASDIDDDKLNFTIINQPAHGTLILYADGNFSYTAGNDSNGTDCFTYIANDGNLNSNNATVILNTHIPTIANNMSLSTRVGKNISSTFNVTDWYGSKLNYTILSNPAHGTLNYTSNGSFIYQPYSNYSGNDSFTYNVYDGLFISKTAIVNIFVNPDNPPVANNMTVLTKKGKSVSKSFNITDVDGDQLTILIVRPPMHGNIKIANGKFIYTPARNFVGTDFFTYLVNDGFLNSNNANVVINVNK